MLKGCGASPLRGKGPAVSFSAAEPMTAKHIFAFIGEIRATPSSPNLLNAGFYSIFTKSTILTNYTFYLFLHFRSQTPKSPIFSRFPYPKGRRLTLLRRDHRQEVSETDGTGLLSLKKPPAMPHGKSGAVSGGFCLGTAFRRLTGRYWGDFSSENHADRA